MTKSLLLALATFLSACASTFAGGSSGHLETVPYVDVEKYMGTWYEIASFPQRFQRGCNATQAEYSLKSNGRVRVVNTCRLSSVDGPIKEAVGRAKIVDIETNAKLKVSFFGPFWGKYWVIDLGNNYEYAVVGHPNRKYLWILSRTRQMDPVLYQQIVDRVAQKGFDVSLLKVTVQPE